LHYDDIALQFGDLMLHCRGEFLHQRTSVAITWAAPSKFGRTLAGRTRTAPAVFRHNFSDLHRFVTKYWRFSGQMQPLSPPPATDK